MMNKAKTISGTSILMYYRDQLKSQADELMTDADKAMSEAKAKYHEAKVKSNALKRQALQVQSAINEELGLKVTEKQIVEETYRIKGPDEEHFDVMNIMKKTGGSSMTKDTETKCD